MKAVHFLQFVESTASRIFINGGTMNKLFLLLACLVLSACGTPPPVVRSVPEADQQKFQTFKKVVESQAKPTEAVVFIVHQGDKNETRQSEFIFYQDIELSGQEALRFKKNEFVKFSIPAGEYRVKARSVCMRKNNTAAPKAGDVITPSHPDYIVFNDIHPRTYLSPLKFEAGQTYVFTYQPECWWNRVANDTELLTYLKAEGGENKLYLPFKAVESRQKAK